MRRKIYCPSYLWDGISDEVVNNRAFCVEEGIITDIGTSDEMSVKYHDAEYISGSEWMILPSFINAHDHGRAVSPVGFNVPDRCLEMWLQDLNKLPPIPHYTAAYYDGINLAAAGVGTVLHSHNPNCWENIEDELAAAAEGYNAAGIRVILCPPYIDQNKGVYAQRDSFIASLPKDIGESFAKRIRDRILTVKEYLMLIDRLRDRLKEQIASGLVEIQLHPNGGQWCSDEALLKMKEYAVAHNMRMHLHLLETKYQRIYAKRKWGCSFIKHYHDIGFLGPFVSFAHAVWLSDDDIRLISDSGAKVINNPSSNMRLRSGVMPLKKLTEKGVVCGLGLDGCSFDDDQDYVREIRVAMLNMGQTGVNGGIDKLIPLKMATAGGAAITGGTLSSGVIQKGVRADFVCFNIKKLIKPYSDPEVSPLELLVQRGTKHTVDAAYVNGIKVYGAEACFSDKREEAERQLAEEIIRLRKAGTVLPDNSTIINAVHDFYQGWEESDT